MGLWITIVSAFRFTRHSKKLWPVGMIAMLGSAQLVVARLEDGDPLFSSNAALRAWLASEPGLAAGLAVVALVGIFGFWLLSEVATGALVLAADAALHRRELSAAQAWRGGMRVWRHIVAVDLLTLLPALLPVISLVALAAAALDMSAAADVTQRVLDFLTSGIYSGFAVVFAIAVWAWRDLAVRHAVIGGERPMEAIHAAVSDMTATFIRTIAVGASLFVASWLFTLVLVPVLYALDAVGLTGVWSLTPSLAWQWILLPGAVLLGPYAVFDASAWTYWYRLLHPAVGEDAHVG
ncbi:MAG: hypothetical protein JXE06_05900 [Coriobacteriia bacterium]|nr:hypothetical protein [Coriobacteriia bacterium]MBN2823191.1 hypothetical protein [Coriobacteriia bacterium]